MGTDQKRALLAVVLSGLILFGWQYFFAPPAPQTAKVKTIDTKAVDSSGANSEVVKNDSTLSQGDGSALPSVEKKKVVLENSNHVYTIDSELSVVQGVFKETNTKMQSFFSPNNNKVQFLSGDVYKSINFSMESVSPTMAKFSDVSSGIEGTVELDEKGFLSYKITSSKPFGYRFTFHEDLDDKDEGGIFSMQAGMSKKQYGYFSDDYNTLSLDGTERGEASFKWFSVDNDYHLFANVLENKAPMLFKTNNGNLYVSSPEVVASLEFKQIFARKEYDQLGALGHNLNKSIDFGIWGLIAVPILRGLQFFYSLIPNYGISIIFLTIIIRMLTFPLQFKSFKSMKKMQEIQPELTKLREKYKSDPQRMQQETMALFKKAGANPIGGCLPMILQMPIFFAFYKVLYSSVELVDAPFFGWIHDLSQKDPYYVLPVLMGLAMVLNQKLMPTTVSDPVQKKVMLFMPLIFAVFMKDFPAGLTLYIFVSTLMGMGQQLFVYKRT